MKTSLKDLAYNYISNAIMSCELKPGQLVVEQEVSNRLNISRTPVREAFKQLEQGGFLVHVPSRGTFVVDITPQDVEEIFQLRELFELTALKTAIVEITDEELDALEKYLHILDENRTNESAIREYYYESDRELHYLIMKYSWNSRMISIHKNLEAQVEQLRRISSLTPLRLSKSKREHLALLSALRSRNLENATHMLSLHLNNVKQSTLNVCKNMRLEVTKNLSLR